MKIAILGSAPSSLGLAPFGDPSWKIWGCSPGVFPHCPRVDAWFELHRWEPPTIGVASKQVPWFSPEYVAWMAMRNPTPPRGPGEPPNCPVWMYDKVPEIPASARLPIEDLKAKYGTYFFTSSIAIMLACAIEDILEEREALTAQGYPPVEGRDHIGLWGVDMAATEEYGYQRAGCQHFLLLAADLGIQIVVPPESDLLRPMPIYGISESSHWMIKNTARRRELEARLANAQQTAQHAQNQVHFLQGALDDLKYQMETWGEDREGMGVSPNILARGLRVQGAIEAMRQPDPDLEVGRRLIAAVNPLAGERGFPEDLPTAFARVVSERDALAAAAKAQKEASKEPRKAPKRRR